MEEHYSNKENKANKGLDNQNKSKFILDILNYSNKSRVDEKTKDKLINLIGKEIEKTNITEKEILRKLETIEEIVSKKNSSTQDLITANSNLPQHKPKDTKLFLSLFDNSDGLKYLTHKFNIESPDYASFIEICRNEYEQGKKDYPNAQQKVVGRIKEFAFSENPEWYLRKGENKISFNKGWSEPTFIEWFKKYKNHPLNDEKWKSEMIIPFKETIEIRTDLENILKLINETIDLVFGLSKSNFDINININNLKTAQFYTDVDMFGQALFHIFSTIKDIAEKRFSFDISVNYTNESLEGGVFKKLIITHSNSEVTRYSHDPEFVKGDLKTIRNNLWGLCNYEIEAKFQDGYKRKILLTDDVNDYEVYIKPNKSISIEDESSIKGFTHILKFY